MMMTENVAGECRLRSRTGSSRYMARACGEINPGQIDLGHSGGKSVSHGRATVDTDVGAEV